MRLATHITLLLFTLFALAGCGDDLAGSYADEAGVTRYTFAGNGAVQIFVLGTEVSAEYQLDDDKVFVSSAQGTVVLTRRGERLYGPMGLELVPQSDTPQGE